MASVNLFSTAHLSEPGDIATAPHDSDRCIIPYRLWKEETMFVRITTATGRKFVLRVGGFHKYEEPYNNGIFVPYWIMANLQPIDDFDEVTMEALKHNVSTAKYDYSDDDEGHIDIPDDGIMDDEPVLQAATKIVLQAYSRMFLEVEDPKTWLECAIMQSMTVMNNNSSIPLSYGGYEFEFNVLRIEPNNRLKAAHLIDTDVEIDFEAPVDYVPPRPLTPTELPILREDVTVPVVQAASGQQAQQYLAPEAPKIFTGTANKLDEHAIAAVATPDDPVARRAMAAAAAKKRAAASAAS